MSRNTLQESARLERSEWLDLTRKFIHTTNKPHSSTEQGRPNLARIDYGEATSPNEEDESVEEEWDEQLNRTRTMTMRMSGMKSHQPLGFFSNKMRPRASLKSTVDAPIVQDQLK